MASPAEEAINHALFNGSAYLKFLAPNDTHATKSHQRGIFLERAAWPIFAPHPPQAGTNEEFPILVRWHDGRVTDSRIKWYGARKREYRLTRFNRERDFPHLREENVGSLFILVPLGGFEFAAFIVSSDDEVLEVQAALGIDVSSRNSCVFSMSSNIERPDDHACLAENYQRFAEGLSEFPRTEVVSQHAVEGLEQCFPHFDSMSIDDQLCASVQAEYELFRAIEVQLSGPEVTRGFVDIDQFLKAAQSILQRRKVRAGRSLEHHVERLLRQAGIPFESQPFLDETRPDLVIPSATAYAQQAEPGEDVYIVGIKRTCKDRWRQVLREAPKVPRKHILTMQHGISDKQMREIASSNITLVVPKSLHEMYGKAYRHQLVGLEEFINELSDKFGEPAA